MGFLVQMKDLNKTLTKKKIKNLIKKILRIFLIIHQPQGNIIVTMEFKKIEENPSKISSNPNNKDYLRFHLKVFSHSLKI